MISISAKLEQMKKKNETKIYITNNYINNKNIYIRLLQLLLQVLYWWFG